MSSMIDRYLIRYFLAVVEQGNFSRAAAHCNVSQPTLSVGIAKLEKNLEHQLLIRSNQRVELTQAGTRFLAHARRIEREFNSALNALSAMATAPQEISLRLGIVHSVSSAVIAQAGKSARSDSGPIELSFASERELLARLTGGRLDAMLTIMRPSIRGFLVQKILEEGYAMVLPIDHSLADRSTVSADEIGGEAMIVRRHCEILSQTSRHFLDRGVRPHFSLRTTSDELALNMVRAGMGITVMPDSYRAPAVRHVRLADFDHRRTLSFYLPDRRHERHPLLLAIHESLNGDGMKQDHA